MARVESIVEISTPRAVKVVAVMSRLRGSLQTHRNDECWSMGMSRLERIVGINV